MLGQLSAGARPRMWRFCSESPYSPCCDLPNLGRLTALAEIRPFPGRISGRRYLPRDTPSRGDDICHVMQASYDAKPPPRSDDFGVMIRRGAKSVPGEMRLGANRAGANWARAESLRCLVKPSCRSYQILSDFRRPVGGPAAAAGDDVARFRSPRGGRLRGLAQESVDDVARSPPFRRGRSRRGAQAGGDPVIRSRLLRGGRLRGAGHVSGRIASRSCLFRGDRLRGPARTAAGIAAGFRPPRGGRLRGPARGAGD